MTLSDISIRRPVFAFMMTVALIVLGLFSYRDLGLDLMPKTDFPNVLVTVKLPDASAEEVETLITVMKAMDFTLNNMTMLAFSLATGIVIDDAIVVLENILRFIDEKGMTPREAASKATDEIGLAVLATTLSLVVIFVPVAFMTGQIGRGHR